MVDSLASLSTLSWALWAQDSYYQGHFEPHAVTGNIRKDIQVGRTQKKSQADLVYFGICVTNTRDQKQLGTSFLLQFTSSTEGSHGRSTEAGMEAETLEECCLLAYSLRLAQPCFF